MPNIGLAALPISTEYRTGDSDPVEDFYRPCLYQAVHYRRAVGFFRSSVYYLIRHRSRKEPRVMLESDGLEAPLQR